jgi:hypothetical protein
MDFVFEPAIGFDQWSTLWQFVRQENQLRVHRQVMEELFEFLRVRQFSCTLFDIQNRLQMREDAILTLTEMVHQSWAMRAHYAANLVELATREKS